MKDVCHSLLFFMSVVIRFVSSPLPSGRLKAFFVGLWGIRAQQSQGRDAHGRRRANGGTAELSLVRGKRNHKGLIVLAQNTHARTPPYTHTHPRPPTHWTWCPRSGRPLYCGIVRTISSWMIKQCISRPSLWWWVCVWSSTLPRLRARQQAMPNILRFCPVFVPRVCVYVIFMWKCAISELLWWAPVDCVPLLTRLPTAAPACEKLLLSAFNGETLVWEKVAKSWEKRALSRRGREGVNHERTCL